MRRTSRAFGVVLIPVLLGSVSPAGARDRASYAFTLERVDGGTMYFSGVRGSPWSATSYGCGDCSFLVSREGVRGPVEPSAVTADAGIIFRLTESADGLELTCRAAKCTFETTVASGKTKSHTVGRGHTKRVPVTVGSTFSVVE
jgi:hypothetical protein